MSRPAPQLDLSAVVAAYRDAAQRERRAKQLTGKRTEDRVYAMLARRMDIELQLRAAGEVQLYGDLSLEHQAGLNLIRALTGQRALSRPGQGVPDLDEEVRYLRRARARIAARLAEHEAAR